MAPLPSAHLLQGTQRESARCGLPLDIAGIAAEAERLQVADVARSALVPGHDVVHPQGPLMLIRAAALAAAPCPGEYPVFHRTADRASVAGAMGVAEGFCEAVHILTPLLAEPVQPLVAQLQQRVAFAVAQLLGPIRV
jgi:hypothetical protein